jgi:uncharacterized protein (DUF4415 family)
MAAKQLKGVGGVLGGLLSPEPPTSTSSEPAINPTVDSTVEPASNEQAAIPVVKATVRHPAHPKTHARRGRPPGSKAGEGADKEKVTLRLNKELMDAYRDWSWDKRCQVGELVEEALAQHISRRRQKSQ